MKIINLDYSRVVGLLFKGASLLYRMESFKGLSNNEVEELYKEFGYNEIPMGKVLSGKDIFFNQFKNTMVYILGLAMILSLVLQKYSHVGIIFIIISIVITLGFVQEYKANKEMNALKKMLVPNSVVIRNGKKEIVLSKDIVPGDIVFLTSGDKVPADGVVLKQTKFEVNESAITGESEPVKKNIYEIEDEKTFIDSSLVVDKNRVFMSSYVTQGNAYVKIMHTGKNTEFGKIANLMQNQDKDVAGNLVNKVVTKFTKFALLMVFLTIVLLLIQAYFSHQYDLFHYLFVEKEIFMILTLALALLVSGIPEGLPVVVTISLAKGMKRMSSKNAIVNKMNSLHDLGKVSFICSDKTGTITKNEMTVKHFYFNGKSYKVDGTGYNNSGSILEKSRKVTYEEIDLFIDAISLCNDAELKVSTDKMVVSDENTSYYDIMGSSTEASLLVLANKAQVRTTDLKYKFERLEEAPFSSERKMMSVLCNYPLREKLKKLFNNNEEVILVNEEYVRKEEKTIFLKGGIDVILKYCNRFYIDNEIKELSDIYREHIKERVELLTDKRYRVLGIAMREDNSKRDLEDLEKENLIFLGYVAIIDPPRQEVKKSIKVAHDAGIKVMMITGDNVNTARAIAKEVGILSDDNKYRVIEGDQLLEMSDEELYDIVEDIRVCARAKPEHKLRIVNALQKRSHVVAMTGDGVNDSPALKKADIGVAIGSGTEVAKEASDIILKDDDFSTIVLAIEEGRHIFENLQKFSSYQLSCNLSQLIVIFLSIVFQLPVLLTAIQILFMNLVTDDMPAISLALNSQSRDIMTWKPKKREDGLFSKELGAVFVVSGLLMTVFTFLVFYSIYNTGLGNLTIARTLALITMIFMQVLFAFSFRSFRKPFFKMKLTTNKWLLRLGSLSLLLTGLVVFTPINSLFEVMKVPIDSLLIPLVYAIIGLILLDIAKIYFMRDFYKEGKKED
ncbi:MAG: cation-transporting P-type ATPase [Candidatus Nanoarchaeia archaeon]|nr:cation-transporting P-type ATPase [Candidatus Nanoarchaeia archaeon]